MKLKYLLQYRKDQLRSIILKYKVNLSLQIKYFTIQKSKMISTYCYYGYKKEKEIKYGFH